MPKTCNAHHPLDPGSWMNLYVRSVCGICAASTAKIAFNCSPCVIAVCVPCASKYDDKMGFALHLASDGRLGLLEDGNDIEHDSGSVLYHEFHRFHNTEVYRARLKAKIAELERMVAEAQEELNDHKQELAESDARCGD